MAVRTASPQGIVKRLFNVAEYHRFGDAGILSEDDRVELINGEVVETSPIGSLHASTVKRIAQLLHEKLGRAMIVGTQDPIQLDQYSEPEPDLSVLKPRQDFYAHAHPKPTDVLLIIEVADTSIEYDRSKLLLYARAEIPEVWLVDLNQSVIELFSAPRHGQYETSHQFRRGDAITSTNVPSLTLAVDEILG